MLLFTFTEEEDMQAAAADLREHGFEVTKGEFTRYLVQVKSGVPPVAESHRREVAQRIARRHGGRIESGNPRKGTVPRRG